MCASMAKTCLRSRSGAGPTRPRARRATEAIVSEAGAVSAPLEESTGGPTRGEGRAPGSTPTIRSCKLRSCRPNSTARRYACAARAHRSTEVVMHHKRKRPKKARAGCLLCKPHKANEAARGTRTCGSGIGEGMQRVASSCGARSPATTNSASRPSAFSRPGSMPLALREPHLRG